MKLIEIPRARLLRVPLDGAPPREIMLTGPLRPGWYVLTSAGIGKDGRIVAPLVSPASWFLVPGMTDLETGRMTPIPVDEFGDYSFLAWTPEGQIVAALSEFRFSLWRLRPEGR